MSIMVDISIQTSMEKHKAMPKDKTNEENTTVSVKLDPAVHDQLERYRAQFKASTDFDITRQQVVARAVEAFLKENMPAQAQAA